MNDADGNEIAAATHYHTYGNPEGFLGQWREALSHQPGVFAP